MTTSDSNNPYEQATQERFLRRLSKLRNEDAALLRRNVGRRLWDSHGVHGVVARLLGNTARWTARARDDYFLVATIATVGEHPERARGDFGVSLHRLRAIRGEALDRRMELLIDADRDQLTMYLSSLAHELAAAHVPVSLSLLLPDVLAWTAALGSVQARWTNSYYYGVRAPKE